MAIENLGKQITLLAAYNLSAYQFRFINVSKAGYLGKVALCGDGEAADGVLQNEPAAVDRAAAVMIGDGETKIVAGGVAAAGDYGASDSVGRAVVASTGDHILGKFLEAPSAAGQVVTFLYRMHPATL